MTAILIAAAVLLIIARQFQTREVTGRSLVVIPLVLIGLGTLQLVSAPPSGALVLGVLALDAGAGIVLGALRGRSIRVWRASDGTWLRKGTTATALLWAVSIAARVAIVALARILGVHDAAAAGPLELAFGASLAAQYAVIGRRCGLVGRVALRRIVSQTR